MDEKRSRGFITGERRWHEQRPPSPIPNSLSLRHLSDTGKPGAVVYRGLYDARTHVSVPFMPVLRHLPRQEVKYSGTSDLPLSADQCQPIKRVQTLGAPAGLKNWRSELNRFHDMRPVHRFGARPATRTSER